MNESSLSDEAHQAASAVASHTDDAPSAQRFDPPCAFGGAADDGGTSAETAPSSATGGGPLTIGDTTIGRRHHRRTTVDVLYRRLRKDGESFWTSVYPLYMRREITRADVRAIVQRGLTEARGNYRIVARLFNIDAHDYKRFLNFLRKHECEVPFKDFR